VRALLRTYFQRYLLGASVIGLGLIALSAVLKAGHANEIATDILRDLGIGSLVSVFVVVFIEWRAGLTLRSEIATDVLEAVYRRMVPKVIYDEVRDSIFRSDVMRRDWELTITALALGDCHEIPEETREWMSGEGVFLVELQTSYVVQNLNDRQVPFLAKGWLDLDVPIEAAGVPRFTAVEVGDDSWELSAALVQDLYRGTRPLLLPNDLRVLVNPGRQIRFEKHLMLPRSGSVRLAYRARCAFRAPGSQVVSAQSPADGIRIETNGTPELEFDVLPLHPQQEGLRSEGSAPWRQWHFARAILPWQGFQIVSSVVAGGEDESVSTTPMSRSDPPRSS
jgi:hypothetical protein